MKQNEEVFQSTLKDIEEDIDQEYIGIQHNYVIKLKHEQDILTKIREENQKMRTEYDALGRMIEHNKEEILKMSQEEKRLHQIIRSLEIDIKGLRKEVICVYMLNSRSKNGKTQCLKKIRESLI